jgi:lysozyme
MARSINAAGVAIIRQAEGLRLTPYKDANGFWTVGYGHKILPEDNISPSDTITLERAEALFQADLAKNAQWLEDDLDDIEVTDNQFSALASLEYNIGSGRFENSTLLEDLDNGDLQKAADQFPVWRMAGGEVQPGLVARRAAERALFLTPNTENAN